MTALIHVLTTWGQEMDFQNDIMTAAEYAAWRGFDIRSEQRERAQRKGPPFIKLGRAVFYRKAAIEAWLIAQEQVQPRAKGAGQ